VEPDASGQPGVDPRAGVVESPPGAGREPNGERPDSALVAEPDRRPLETDATVEPYLVRSVDHDVADTRLVQQRLERSRAGQRQVNGVGGAEERRVAEQAGLSSDGPGDAAPCR
jgi:hypothetical protein